MSLAARRCVPVVSHWVETVIEICDGRLALLMKDGTCCYCPRTNLTYVELALVWASKGKFVWRFLGRMPHRIQDYRVIAYPCPPAGCPTTTSVQSSEDPSNQGDLVTFTATVSNGTSGGLSTPTGSVEFFDGSTDLGPGSALSGSGGSATSAFSTSGLSVGSHTITAKFTGTNNWQNSQGSVTQTVNSSGQSACGCSGVPNTLHVTVSSQTGNCGISNFTVTYQSNGDWQGSDNNGNTWHVTCHPGNTSCAQFILSSSSYGVNVNPGSCSCSPFTLTFAGVSLSGVGGCTGTATFTVTP